MKDKVTDIIFKDLRERWGKNATIYRDGNRIAILAVSGYVTEFEVLEDGSTRTLQYGVLVRDSGGLV